MTTPTTTKIFQIYIKADPQKIWDAITSPEWNAKYGYQAPGEYELRAGGAYRAKANADMLQMGLPEVIIDGEVVEADPPRRLVQTYRWLFTPQSKAEGFTRVTWEITPTPAGFTKLTLIHDVTGAPDMAAAIVSDFSEQGGGGWNWILSDLKSLLETGAAMTG